MGHRLHVRWWYLGGAIIGLSVALSFYLGPKHLYSSPTPAAPTEESLPKANVEHRVETIRPTQGGLAKNTSQPGSAHSFESAELYSKVSGFLKEQHVDIGTRVKRGQLLAELDVPELREDVAAAEAMLKQAEADVVLAQARVESGIADQKAAEAKIAQVEADAERWKAEAALSQKQYDRIQELSGLKGIEARLVDEQLCKLQSAQASHRSSISAIAAAKQQALAAQSKVDEAKAELAVRQSKVAVAASALERAKVMLAYTKITSPYDGVVTLRNFHRGAYVRSPDHGGQVALLAVDRTDQMRVQVRIPEREVPYIQPGDKSKVRFDALPQRVFEGTVSRIAESEEAASRTMLAEIDLPNPDQVIRDHMFGRVEIELEEPQQSVTIPSACLVGDVTNSLAKVFVVVDNQAKLKEVQIGKDTGVHVEVLSGISANDQVVIRPPGGLGEGCEVACTECRLATKTN